MDPKTRFSSRVENYVKYRPGYPAEVLAIVQRELAIAPPWVVADVGAGTGISSQLFLSAGHVVYAVEPNDDMRRAGENILGDIANFHPIPASAEATTLPDKSVDLIVCAQAFHWFDQAATKKEFQRILKNNGQVLLLWNTRRTDFTPFLREYENLLLDFVTDYSTVRHENINADRLRSFFSPRGYRTFTTANFQNFDFVGVRGRLLSSSYAPLPDDPRHIPMLTRLREIFDKHQINGQVAFEYDTEMFLGRF